MVSLVWNIYLSSTETGSVKSNNTEEPFQLCAQYHIVIFCKFSQEQTWPKVSCHTSLLDQSFEYLDFLARLVRQVVVGRLEDERDVVKGRAVHDAAEPLDADLPLANVLVAAQSAPGFAYRDKCACLHHHNDRVYITFKCQHYPWSRSDALHDQPTFKVVV